jgi:hypothetical protein
MWVIALLTMVAFVGGLMLVTGLVLATLHRLYLAMGNPGALLRPRGRPKRGPGEGYYDVPPLHD